MTCPHNHLYKITVRSLLDYKKLVASRGRIIAFKAYLIVLADGRVIKDCAANRWVQVNHFSNKEIHNLREDRKRMTFFAWVDEKLPTDRDVIQFILDYNHMHGRLFDTKYGVIPAYPDCGCAEACSCFEFDLMRHIMERGT